MAGDIANPRIWLTADCYVGPLGTTAPTDIATALNVGFVPLGLLSEDGASETRDQDSTDFHAWGGILIRTVKSKFTRSIKVTFLEDNKTVWALVNPGSSAVTASTITTRTVKNPTSDPRAFVLELRDGAAITTRRVIPRGEVTEVADITLADSDIMAYEATIKIYADSAGVLYKDITNDPQAIVP